MNSVRFTAADQSPAASSLTTTGLREDAEARVARRPLHQVVFRRIDRQGQGRQAVGGEVDIQNLHGGERQRQAQSTAPVIRPISPMLEESRYIKYFLMLPTMPRPSSTAATIEAKLSSVRIIAAASLLTSVPVMPMAMPMSAFLSAGASFTPSPVIATTWPRSCTAVTTRSL